MTALDPWLRAELLTFFLACTRATGLIVVAPLAWTNAPNRIRVVLVLLLGMIGHGQTALEATWPRPPSPALALATELILGAAMGFVLRLSVAAAEIAGEVVAPTMGLGAAQMFDPGAQANQNMLAKLLRYLTIFLALVAGVHRVLLGALIGSYRVLPVGAPIDMQRAFPMILGLTADALVVGVRMALPLLAILFMSQLALAFIARAAPAMQIFSIGFAVTLCVGGTVLFLVLPDMARAILADASHVGPRLESLLLEIGARS